MVLGRELRTEIIDGETVPQSGSPIRAAELTASALEPFVAMRPHWAAMYEDLHAHPELSLAEHRTARILAGSLRGSGLEVTEGVGGTGVVGVLRNGDGPVVMIRGDMDALPIREETGRSYASRVTVTLDSGEVVPVMHACGHDMHTTCLAATADVLARAAGAWSGTLLVVGQPAEETLVGASAMLDDGLFTRFPKPDVALGQHVIPIPAGTVAHATGQVLAGTASIEIRVFGQGGHGSQPASCIDPVVTSAFIVTRVQTVVSRETPAENPVVITVGVMRAGTKANIIPDEAILVLNVRAGSEKSLQATLTAIRRIAAAEADASGCERPPEFRIFDTAAPTINDEQVGAVVAQAHVAALGDRAVRPLVPLMGSEDFSEYGMPRGRYEGDAVPYCFWMWGGVAPEAFPADHDHSGAIATRAVPSNHTSRFALDVEPTLTTGVQLLTSAALALLTT